MDVRRFKRMVERLERESAVAPRAYRAKVAALALLGFGILALLLGTLGLGLVMLAGIVVALLWGGGSAWILLLKFGKVLWLLAIPLYFLVRSSLKALFVRLPAPAGREVTRADAPALFAALDGMRAQMQGPRFHHVLVVDAVNAAVVQRPAFGLIGWPRNYLLLGLPLLESLPALEALAVVAHEYGHLAGAHGRFSSFVYRLRITWGTVQAFTDHVQGWLGRLVAPLVRWYAPYFNAYTFVLARADEYQADAAAARLVGATEAAHALKRVNLVAPQHEHFMQRTFERIDHQSMPPPDLMQRWAAQAGRAPAPADAQRWLGQALDREGQLTDTHPTLRARLTALDRMAGPSSSTDAAAPRESISEVPPPLSGPSAAQQWLGPLADALRTELAALWADGVAAPWAEQHAQACKLRERLGALRAQVARDTDEQIELLRLALRLEPERDHRDALAAFNAAHPEHALGLYLEGQARLDQGEREGLALLERAMAVDPEATKPACERAITFLNEHVDSAAAQAYAERWRARDQLETQRAQQLAALEPESEVSAHGLSTEQLTRCNELLNASARESIDECYLARRPIAADPNALQYVLGVRLSRIARWGERQQAVLQRLAALEWPVPVVVVALDGAFEPLRLRLRALGDARLF